MPYDTGLHRSERQLPAPGDAFEFTPENRARLEEIAKRYRQTGGDRAAAASSSYSASRAT